MCCYLSSFVVSLDYSSNWQHFRPCFATWFRVVCVSLQLLKVCPSGSEASCVHMRIEILHMVLHRYLRNASEFWKISKHVFNKFEKNLFRRKKKLARKAYLETREINFKISNRKWNFPEKFSFKTTVSMKIVLSCDFD